MERIKERPMAEEARGSQVGADDLFIEPSVKPPPPVEMPPPAARARPPKRSVQGRSPPQGLQAMIPAFAPTDQVVQANPMRRCIGFLKRWEARNHVRAAKSRQHPAACAFPF